MHDETLRWDVIAEGFGFLESPRQDAEGELYFSDLTKGGLFRRELDGRITSLLPERDLIGGIVANRGGSVVLSGRGGLVRFDPRNGKLEPLLTTIGGAAINHINDIEADPHGRIYGGTIDFDALFAGRAPAPGYLFRVAPGGEPEIIRDDVSISNGLAFSPAHDRFYHSETGVGIWSYDFVGEALPCNPRLLIEIYDSDGITVDPEGGVWVARVHEGKICRYRPDGTLDLEIQLPWQATSLCFGGGDFRGLYVTCGGLREGADKESAGHRAPLLLLNTGAIGLPSNLAGF